MHGEPRTLAPPERRLAEVSANVRVGSYAVISASDATGPPDARPGQFYMLSTGERWGGETGERPYLPRAFSFARTRPSSAGGAELDFLLEDVGPGTHRLAALTPGESLGLVGPLGVGFRPPSPGTRPLLVGGGIGVAPLVGLHAELRASGSHGLSPSESPRVLLGFRGESHAHAAALFDAPTSTVTVCTEDGSLGRPGLVTEPLREELDRDRAATVLACGPPPMLEAVRALCAELAVPAQLALESGMACGYGACFGCVAPTREGYIRICVDGPVIDAGLLETAIFAGAGH